ncbi:MAG: hypothetical protein FWG25_10445 [Promicromonosporaceae bacterium]|nr:hypothetical protein [Promicromonosporaceae bacterium]
MTFKPKDNITLIGALQTEYHQVLRQVDSIQQALPVLRDDRTISPAHVRLLEQQLDLLIALRSVLVARIKSVAAAITGG